MSRLEVDVSARFGSFAIDAAFTAPPHGITALFGPSGSGKSSIAALIAGLARPRSGRIALGDRVLFDADRRIDVPARRRHIGVVFQDGRLFPHLSVKGNLTYGSRRLPPPERLPRLDRVVDLLGIGELMQRRPATLSGGERQRVAIGRALLSAPELLIMDEPMAALDAPRKGEIMPYVERLRDEEGVPVVLITHALDEIIRLADTLVALDRGSVITVCPVVDALNRPELRPLIGEQAAGTLIDARVESVDPGGGLVCYGFSGGRLVAPRRSARIGQAVRVRIGARDVSLALRRPEAISVHNILEGTVRSIEIKGDEADVLVDAGVPILARVTRHAVESLNLRPDLSIYALIKAMAVSVPNRDEGTAVRSQL